MGMIGNTLAQGLISGANIVDGTVDTPDIKDSAVTNAKIASGVDASKLTTGTLPTARLDTGAAVSNIGYTPVNKAGDTMTGDLTSTGTVNTGSTTGAHHKINGTFDGIAMSRHGTQAVVAGNWSGAGGWGLGSGGGHTVKLDQVSGTNPYDFQNATDIDLQLGANRKVTHTGTQKRGLDFTGSAMPNKFHHDFIWYQFAGEIAPSQVPIYCANIDAAEKLAVWYVQRLYTELKNTENDSMYDGLHWRMPTTASVFSKIVSGGGSAPPSSTVDYDNAVGDGTTSFQQYAEWFEVIIGSNGSTEIYTMALALGLNSASPLYPTRIIFQRTRNASNWLSDYPSWTLSNADGEAQTMAYAPKCTTRTTSFTATVTNVGIMLYPITMELNF